MRILKFGGKSLDSKEKVQKICKFIKKIYKNDKKLIIVVSAMGDTTDNLAQLSADFGASKKSDSETAKLLATGEVQSACLFATCLKSMSVPAKSMTAADIELLTFGDYLNARVAYINKTKIEAALGGDTVLVVCGFQGINRAGEITTLGRGGSDTTAAALSSAFGVPAEIYSDFDGVFAGDPRVLPYKKIKQIDFDTMLSMSRAGAKVLDERAIEIAKTHNQNIISKSSSCPEKQGTTISNIKSDVVSVSCSKKLNQITITFSNPAKKNHITQIAESCLEQTKYYHFQISQQEISFCVESSVSDRILKELSAKLKLIKKQA